MAPLSTHCTPIYISGWYITNLFRRYREIRVLLSLMGCLRTYGCSKGWWGKSALQEAGAISGRRKSASRTYSGVRHAQQRTEVGEAACVSHWITLYHGYGEARAGRPGAFTVSWALLVRHYGTALGIKGHLGGRRVGTARWAASTLMPGSPHNSGPRHVQPLSFVYWFLSRAPCDKRGPGSAPETHCQP